jgi:predicted dehydrogenase
LIDLFIWMLGPVARVYGQISSHVFENDTAVAILTFDSGQTVSITNVMATAELRYFHLYGSEAWVRRIDDTTLVIKPRGGEEEEITFSPSFEVRANNEAFADAVAGHAEYPISTEDMIHNVAVLDAISQSMQIGQPVDVEPLSPA